MRRENTFLRNSGKRQEYLKKKNHFSSTQASGWNGVWKNEVCELAVTLETERKMWLGLKEIKQQRRTAKTILQIYLKTP